MESAQPVFTVRSVESAITLVEAAANPRDHSR